MEHLNAPSQDLFLQYRIISGKLKKRFMKKPNVREASEDYGKLANALKNEDNPQYAALCFSAMAKCDQLLGDAPGEAEAWCNAGLQFLQAEELLYSTKHATYWESLEAGVHCYLLAIAAHERQHNDVMAAMFCLEVAHKLQHFQKYHEALSFLLRAVDFQSEKPECQLQTLEEVASCKIKLREYDGALGVLTRICVETEGKEGPYSVLRKRCETSQILLLLMLQIPRGHMRSEHSQLLEKYSMNLLEAAVANLGSDGNMDLYILLHSLIVAVESRDYSQIEHIRPGLWKLLEPEQEHLFHLLMDVHCPHRHTLL